ncbi:MAG: hypothetical protein BWK78_03050 [Thiotrichaceae bacterium IS1]|nr:MAG: hypothetical protein BWK78_03050 [Thiotrichaceae bacterium IS1]
MQYPLKEKIGRPKLFVEREQEFQLLNKWLANIPKLLGKFIAILARRKSGKTCLVQQIFNRLWSETRTTMIPFYFAFTFQYILLTLLFGILGAEASEKTMTNEIYETTSIAQSEIVLPKSQDSNFNKASSDDIKALVEDIKLIYPIGEELSKHFKKAEWILTSDGIAVVQLELSKTNPPKILTLKGTWGSQNGITQLHVIGRETHGLKIAIDSVLQPSNSGFRMDGIFTASVRDARQVEKIVLNLGQNLNPSENKWGDSIIDEARKAKALKQSSIEEKQLLTEPTEWIGGVPVPTIFDVDIIVKLDGTQLKPMKGQLLLDKAEGLAELTVDVMLTTGGVVVPGWSAWVTEDTASSKFDLSILSKAGKLSPSVGQTSQTVTALESNKHKNTDVKVTTNGGHIQVVITSPPPFGNIHWFTRTPEHPDEDAQVLVDDGVIDIQLDKEGKKVSGTINAKGKVLADNRPVSTFSAELSGKQQGRDLVERIARDVGARPFDGRWNDPNLGELSLHQQSDRVSGKFSGGNIEEGIVTNSVVNLRWKNSMGESHKGFLSAATDGLLVGMTWNEKSLSFKPVVAVQVPLTDKSNSETSSVIAIKNDAQARELKYLGQDLASIGKHQEATKILLQVVEYYHAHEASSQDLRGDLVNQALPLNTLINSAFEAGEYRTLIDALKMALHVQNELQKSKVDSRSLHEQVGKYTAELKKSAERMDNLKSGFDRGITALSTSGIGINFDEGSKGAGLKISGVRPDMPASRAGVTVDDLLVAIDGVSVVGMDTEQASKLLRGDAGSSVSIKVLRNGQYHDFKLVRVPLINISSEQREELAKNMKAIRDFVADTGKYYHDEADKLDQLSKDVKDMTITDLSVSFKTLTDNVVKHQELLDKQRPTAIGLAERCLAKSPTALNLFQRFVSLMNVVRDGKMDEETSAGLLKLDQEEEAFENNPNTLEIDKGSLTYSIIIVSEFDTMRENTRNRLRLVKHVVKFSPQSLDAVPPTNTLEEFANWVDTQHSKMVKDAEKIESLDVGPDFYKDYLPSLSGATDQTARTLAGLSGWLDAWRTRMVTDAAKIESLNLGQDFYADYVQTLVEMNLPEQALQASEVARARAFADLLARSHSSTTGQPTETSLTSFSSTKTMTLDEIRQLVRDTGITVVEYFVLKDGLLMWVITPPLKPDSKDVDIHFHKTQVSQKILKDKVANLVKTLKPTQKDIAANEKEMTSELKNLYDILIAPIEHLLPKNPDQVVTIVPHDSLFKIPFAALARSINKDGKIDHYLVEDHTLTYAPSLTVLNLSRQMKRETVVPSSLLAVIRPALGKDELGKDFDPLPKVEDISKATVNFYNSKSTLVLSGLEATQSRLFAEAPSRDVVLFYTHAKAIEEDPLTSYIALARDEVLSDGLLRVRTIGNQHLNARLVILAACETGRGKITGDGVQGLARMFMVAGAKAVMVSLWSVSQEATLELMKAFHHAWRKKGRSIAASLQQAQIQLFKQEGYPEVPMWAGFIIIGDEQ